MENNNENGSQTGIKIIVLLSLVLLLLDLFEFCTTFTTIIHYNEIYSIEIFNECIKYQSIAQLFFALFGSFAAISACLLSLGLVISFDLFIDKLLQCFLYYNYNIFGPFLLGSCFIGGYYFKQSAYICDEHQNKHLHFTMVFSLFFSFIISVCITIIYSMISSTSLLYYSIRFQPNGNVIIGRMFWFFIQNRVQSSLNNEIVNNPNNRSNDNNNNNSLQNQELVEYPNLYNI